MVISLTIQLNLGAVGLRLLDYKPLKGQKQCAYFGCETGTLLNTSQKRLELSISNFEQVFGFGKSTAVNIPFQ